MPLNPDESFITIINYNPGEIESNLFWTGRRSIESLPVSTRLFVGAGPYADHLDNPLSWPIVSFRLNEILKRRAANGFQSVPAPLFMARTLAPVHGYSIINVSRYMACLNIER